MEFLVENGQLASRNSKASPASGRDWLPQLAQRIQLSPTQQIPLSSGLHILASQYPEKWDIKILQEIASG